MIFLVLLLFNLSLSFIPRQSAISFIHFDCFDCTVCLCDRLAGASLIAPVINHWWPDLPANLSKQGFSKHLPQDQWALGVAHYAPWLVHWWESQKYFPALSVSAHSRDILNSHDKELLPKIHPRRVDYMVIASPYYNSQILAL